MIPGRVVLSGLQQLQRFGQALGRAAAVQSASLSQAAAHADTDSMKGTAMGDTPINKYLSFRRMRHEEPQNYFRLMMTQQESVLPFIYTPTVGEACQRYHELPIKTDGLYLTLQDRGQVAQKLRAWPQQDIQVIVVTDGERILGLGDLGANGMGITEGKITLYTAAAGVDPQRCLPICLDMGTNNQRLINHPLYKGLRRPRATKAEFDALLQEFMEAVRSRPGHTVVQFEDFGGTNAFRLLETYRHQQPCFNDDIQGTAAITLAAVLAALRGSGARKLADQRFLFLGAGEAGTGIGQLLAYCLHRRSGIPMQEALQHCYFVDSKGLVCKSRESGLQDHKLPFAHEVPFCKDLTSAIQQVKPTVLIGVSAVAGAFSEEVVRAMAALNKHPVIMPLSNPTSLSECTFEQAFRWTDGRVLFASGSPFDPITAAGSTTIWPAQANNAYVFPAVGHAASLLKWQEITDEAFLLAAEELAGMTTVEEIAVGRLFPPFSKILDISASIMGRLIHELGNQRAATRDDCNRMARSAMWHFSSMRPTSKL